MGVHEQLIDIWSAGLSCQVRDIDADFFNLGGDSVTALRVRVLAEEAGLVFKTADLFRYPTIRELAAHLAAGPEIVGVSGGQLRREGGGDEGGVALPLLPMQASILGSEGGTAEYVVQDWFDVSGRLDRQRLDEAYRAITRRHEALRLRFPLHLAGIAQLVRPSANVSLRYESVRRLRDLDEAVSRARAEECASIDLATAEPQQLMALEIDVDTWRVVWTVHHAVADGWSGAVFWDELLREYTSPLTDEPPSYRAYVELATRAHLRSEMGEVLSPYIPRDAVAGGPPRPGLHSISLPSTALVHDAVGRHGFTAAELFFGAYARFLGCVTGETVFDAASIDSGRDVPVAGVDRMMGCLVGQIHTRVDCLDVSGPRFLHRLRERRVEAGSFARPVDIDALFLFQNYPDPVATAIERDAVSFDGLRLNGMGSAEATRVPVSIVVHEANAQYACDVKYRAELFDPATIETFGDLYKDAVASELEALAAS